MFEEDELHFVFKTLIQSSTRLCFQGYVPKKNRIFRSGPLIPQGGNMEDLLKEHERQIQEAVRRSRLGKSRAKESSLD